MKEAFIESSDVGHVFIFSQVEPDVEHEAVELGIELYTEEGHGKNK